MFDLLRLPLLRQLPLQLHLLYSVSSVWYHWNELGDGCAVVAAAVAVIVAAAAVVASVVVAAAEAVFVEPASAGAVAGQVDWHCEESAVHFLEGWDRQWQDGRVEHPVPRSQIEMQEMNKDSHSDVRVDRSAVAVDDDRCIVLKNEGTLLSLEPTGMNVSKSIPFLSMEVPYA